MLMLQLVFLMVGVVDLMMASGEIRRMFVKRDSEDNALRCQAILTSSNVQFFEQNVFVTTPSIEQGRKADSEENEQDRVLDILVDNNQKRRFEYDIVDRSSRLERIARTLRTSKYAQKICNPETFYPYIADSSDSTMSCYQVCTTCVPGSAAVCHQRNHRFPGVGQTCFCTYDFQNPLHNAVLVIKNAPRVRGYSN